METATSQITNISQSEIQLDYFSGKNFSATIVEDKQFIYFANNNGVYKQNKDTLRIQHIYSAKNVNQLSTYDDFIYFVQMDTNEICRIKKDGTTFERIYSKTSVGYDQISLAQFNYQIVEDVLYIGNADGAVCKDLETNKEKILVDNRGVSAFQTVGNHFYYIDHAERTFTIYDLNLKTNETSILLGEGKTEPQKDMIRNFIWINDQLYVYQSAPDRLYCKNRDKSESVILIDKDIRDIFCYQNDLYYVVYDNAYTSYLYRYDLKNGNKKVAVLDEYDLSGVTIVGGYVYYNAGVDIVHDEYGHDLYDYQNSQPTMKQIIG